MINLEEKQKKIQKQDNDKLNINKTKTNSLDSEFRFESIQNEKCKILFLINNNIIFVGTFPKSSSTQYQRLLLIHIYIALINFKGDLIPILKKLNEYEEYDKNNFINLKLIYTKNLNMLTKESNDILELLIFEYYFLKPLILHFSKVFNEIFKKEDMNLKQTKFRNLYLLDVNNMSIILDMCKVQGHKNLKKNKQYYKYKKLFEEIIYHSKNMYNEYVSENEMRYNSADLDFRFVKFECTSTYPRILFIMKFIPVLKGIVIIHIYSQKKLSRNNENNMQLEQGLNFKEVDLLFGSFIKDNPNFEFKYGAPKKLEHIEKFIEEFFITGRSGLGLFRSNNPEKKYKYVNYNIINIINNYQISNNADIDEIFTNINTKIKQDYEEYQNDKKQKMKNNEDDKNKSNYINDDENETKKLDNLFILNKDSFYNDIFVISKNKNNSRNKINDKNDINSYKKYISIDDNNKNGNENIDNKKIDINNDDDKDNILNINDMINTERKLLSNQNKTISLYNSKDINNYKNNKSISKTSKYDDFSKISDVKNFEQFEIKINKKEEIQNQQNKEETKEKISNNSLEEEKEKEYKLNELLDLINSSKKIPSYKIDNNKIQEDFKENEITKKDNLSKINQVSISRKKRTKILVDRELGPGSGTSRSSLIHNQ